MFLFGQRNLIMKKGFTLLEITVVTIIIGVLASLAIPKLYFAVEKSKSGEGLQLLEAIRKSQWTYFYENTSTFSTTLASLDITIVLPTEHFDLVTVNSSDPIATIRRIGDLYTISIDANGFLDCSSADPNMCSRLGL